MLNDYLSSLPPSKLDGAFDQIKTALKSQGMRESSAAALTQPNKPQVQCCKCEVWQTLEELQAARCCVKCGNTGEFNADMKAQEK